MSAEDKAPDLYPEDSPERMAYFLWLGIPPSKVSFRQDEYGGRKTRVWYDKRLVALPLADYKTSDFNKISQAVVACRSAIHGDTEDKILDMLKNYRPKYDY